jgi:hypothetical protein
MLCALAAAFIVTGLAALRVLQPYLRRLEPASARSRAGDVRRSAGHGGQLPRR